ncbi:HD domain-containing phosphohydrolase [Sulfurimonas sp.]|jgi:HD-GYP domain-containing protein (c-di-GMP phosphodiesterase class II)|uniref:HD-GYP domain-containing protein n=1 Tax=Sulfurimonas sp. TaxID=2022749 RepID=UPI002A3660A1|nr:HD domain-containing phosphohydrolase [Sulfurimonas sp.]MDY0123825.1 HD domain-containing protein [Sulfurimonas sp.]
MKIVKTKLNYARSYTLLDIDALAVGAVTLFDIFIKKNRDYIIIIEAGTTLTQNLYDKLKKQENLYINKSDEDKQILSCETLKHYIKYNKDDHKKRLGLLYQVNDQLFEIFMVNKENKINLGCVELIIDAIIYLLKYDDIFIKNTMPHMINDHMLKNHSLHVAIYALTLGYTLKFSDEQLLKLGSAALLHDLGVKKIDKNIINKESELTPKETAVVRKHSQYSVEILKQNKIHDPYIIDAVMHHHERYDGLGYPDKQTKGEISDFASILSICDVFDALTNNRPYRPHYSSFDALKMMMKDPDMVNRFNQPYLHIALKLL